jgi:hypothetical protein
VDDGVGPREVEEAGDGCGVAEVRLDGGQAGGGRRAAVSRRDREAAFVEERRQPPAEQPARASDQDAQRGAQPTITAPPFTDRICPCK